eukprot:scaffold236440_cov18-Tisochrysis_lutea.AAC.1
MEPSPYPRHEGYVAEKLEMVNKAAGGVQGALGYLVAGPCCLHHHLLEWADLPFLHSFLWRRMRAAFKPRKEAAREVPPGAVQQQAATGAAGLIKHADRLVCDVAPRMPTPCP